MLPGEEPIYPVIVTDSYSHNEWMSLRQLIATNAQRGIVSNAITLIEITKRFKQESVKDRDELFLKIFAGLSVAC